MCLMGPMGPHGIPYYEGDQSPEKEKLLEELFNLAIKERDEGKTEEGQKKLRELLSGVDKEGMGNLCFVNQIRLELCERPKFQGTYKITINKMKPRESQIEHNGESVSDLYLLWQTIGALTGIYIEDIAVDGITEITVDDKGQVFTIFEGVAGGQHKKGYIYNLMLAVDSFLHPSDKPIS